MNDYFLSVIKKATGASKVWEVEVIQNLWSNYGQIVRCGLEGTKTPSVIAKHVRHKDPGNHPKGWSSNISHERKLRSYQVETEWYKSYSSNCNDSCRIPHCLAVEVQDDEVLMVLEDLDAAGYPVRKQSVNWKDIEGCLSWLANFHATFLGTKPEGLWETGTYWHLETRPDELKVLDDIPLKKAAAKIDQKLKESPFQTLVHGDAKIANFCFPSGDDKVAAVDFQYVGGGCGMKDLAYFIGSCLNEVECEEMESQILNFYFSELKKSVENQKPDIDTRELEKDWRKLFPVAWADFHRFLKGWSPGHWKINSYSERLSREVISAIEKGGL